MSSRAKSGTVIEGKFRLEYELGAGGMGAVWLATQLTVDRKVAVKLLHPAFLDQEELQQRFEVEAKAIAKLNHPNCITLYDFGFSEDLGAFYTVIEYIDGSSLDKKLGQQLSVEEAVTIIRSVALALDHAHHKGILHRDLKPENIMVARNEQGGEIIKVLDFGIARMMKGDASEESQRITKAGEVFGTPAYMSPEQARSVRQVTPAADLYSLGVMLYELLEGRLPFFSNSAFDLLMMHVTKPVPPMTRLDVPEPLQAMIFKLLEKDPALRFQTGKALVEYLDTLDLYTSHVSQALARRSQELPRPVTPQPTITTPPGAEIPQLSAAIQPPRETQYTTNIDVGGKKGVLVGAILLVTFVILATFVYLMITPTDDAVASVTEPSTVLPELDSPTVEPAPDDTEIAKAIEPEIKPMLFEEPVEFIPEPVAVDVVAEVDPTPKMAPKTTKKTTRTTTQTKTSTSKKSDTTTKTPVEKKKPDEGDTLFKSHRPVEKNTGFRSLPAQD